MCVSRMQNWLSRHKFGLTIFEYLLILKAMDKSGDYYTILVRFIHLIHVYWNHLAITIWFF